MLAADMSSLVSLEESSLRLPKHSTFLWLSLLCVGLLYTWGCGGTCCDTRCWLMTTVNPESLQGIWK